MMRPVLLAILSIGFMEMVARGDDPVPLIAADAPSTPPATAAATAPAARKVPTFDDIRLALKASYQQPPLSYSYTALWEGGEEYECRFARREETYWFACLSRVKGKIYQTHESAWDGETSYVRMGLGIMTVAKDPTRAYPIMDPPEKSLMYPICEAYGLNAVSDTPDLKYTFQGIKMLGDNLAVASFSISGLPDASLEVCHQLDRACTPLFSILRSRGTISAEWKDIEQTKLTWEGNEYWMITKMNLFTRSAKDPNELFLRSGYVVDPKSIVVGDDVRTDMALAPMPNESIMHFDQNRMSPPKDPNWKPDKSIGFPFDHVLERAAKNISGEQAR